jgi:hypothetical protein
MAVAASARGQRVAVMASPLHELMTDSIVAVDCRSAGCRGERKFAMDHRLLQPMPASSSEALCYRQRRRRSSIGRLATNTAALAPSSIMQPAMTKAALKLPVMSTT